MVGSSGVVTVNVAGVLIPVFQARSVAITYRVYVPLVSVPVAVVPVVVIFCVCVPVINMVYQDMFTSSQVHVNTTVFVVLIVLQLTGVVPVVDGLVVSMVNVIHVVFPRMFESTKTYFASPVIGVPPVYIEPFTWAQEIAIQA